MSFICKIINQTYNFNLLQIFFKSLVQMKWKNISNLIFKQYFILEILYIPSYLNNHLLIILIEFIILLI